MTKKLRAERQMVPNHLRPTLEQQQFIVRVINVLGYNPFDKPVHLYTLEELRRISLLYRAVTADEQPQVWERQLRFGTN